MCTSHSAVEKQLCSSEKKNMQGLKLCLFSADLIKSVEFVVPNNTKRSLSVFVNTTTHADYVCSSGECCISILFWEITEDAEENVKI